jgi:hypothetical protein
MFRPYFGHHKEFKLVAKMHGEHDIKFAINYVTCVIRLGNSNAASVADEWMSKRRIGAVIGSTYRKICPTTTLFTTNPIQNS